MYLAYLLTFFLAFYLIYLRRFFVVEVRRGSLWSRACCSGPMGTSAIKSLQLRSGGDHCDQELAVEVRRGPLRSRACSWGAGEPLRSRACSWGPVGTTAIKSLRLRSGGDHCDQELAVEVRRGTLRSSACSWGPAEEEAEEQEAEEQEAEEAGDGRKAGGTADIKSNNPHLTGGEKKQHDTSISGLLLNPSYFCCWSCSFLLDRCCGHSQAAASRCTAQWSGTSWEQVGNLTKSPQGFEFTQTAWWCKYIYIYKIYIYIYININGIPVLCSSRFIWWWLMQNCKKKQPIEYHGTRSGGIAHYDNQSMPINEQQVSIIHFCGED